MKYENLLFESAVNGASEQIRLCIAKGVNVNAQSLQNNNKTALHLIMQKGSLEAVNFLLEAGADMEIRDEWGNNALYCAAWYGRKEIVIFLLERGANYCARGGQGLTPAEAALHCGFPEVAELLSETAVKAMYEKQLFEAAMQGDTGQIRLSIAKGVNVNAQSLQNNNKTALHLIMQKGSLEAVNLMLEAGADMEIRDEWGNNALYCAAWYGRKEIVIFLLEREANYCAKGGQGLTPAEAALHCKFPDIAELLSETAIKAMYERKLFEAAMQGDTDQIKFCISKDVNVNAQSIQYDNKTALHLIMEFGCLEAVSLLIAAGADMEIKDKWGNNTLYCAAWYGRKDIAIFLLIRGANYCVKGGRGLTPAEAANYRRFPEIANLMNEASVKKLHEEVAVLMESSKIWKSSGIPFSMDTAVSYIGNAIEKIQPAIGKDLVLVIGNTGAGKSALINYLLGTRYELESSRNRYYVKRRGGDVEKARVGSSATISETLYPEVFFYGEGDEFALCDLAGFSDTRGEEKAICAASSTQILARSGRQVKALLLVLSYDDLKGTRALAFKRVCKVLHQVIQGNLELIEKSLYFVVSKAEGYSAEEIIQEYLQELLEHPTEGLMAKQQAGRLSEEESSLHDILVVMRKSSQRILVPDIGDEGESPRMLLSAVRESIAQPPQCFDFTRHDASQVMFNQVLFKIAQWYLAAIRRLEEIPEAIKIEQRRIKVKK